jgi:plasmid replication initiation protein
MPTPKKQQLVIQSNKLIESRYYLTTLEQRLVLAMASKIQTDDADFFLYELTLNELAKLMDVSMPNIHHVIDDVTDKLMSRIIFIEDEDGWLKMGWVASCRYNKNKGTVIFRFAPELKPYLLHLQREFTKLSLSIITKFQSVYSVRMYQLLKQYINIGYRILTVKELREILGIEKDIYKEFKEFKRRVLMQAKKEFDDKKNKSDLTFDLETIKEGRKIVRLKFIILKRSPEQPQPAEPVQKVPAAKKQPLSPEMLEFKKHLEEIGDTFMLDLLKDDPQAFMVKATFSEWRRKKDSLQPQAG